MSYPWENSAAAIDNLRIQEFPVDDELIWKENQDLKSKVVELSSQVTDMEELIKQQTSQIAEIQKVSQTTFDKLTKQSEHLRLQVEELTSQNSALKTNLEVHKENEFIYPIIVNAIISKKSGLIGEAKVKKTTDGVITWMSQRAKVVRYLRENHLFPSVADHLESLLFVTDTQLLSQIRGFII